MSDQSIFANMIASLARQQPELDVLTFVEVRRDGSFAEQIRTPRALWDNGQRIARGLLDAGMRRGENFALLMQNHPEFVDAMTGSCIAGTVFVPIDPRTRGDKLRLHAGLCQLPWSDRR